MPTLTLYPLPGNEERAQAIGRALEDRADVRVADCTVHRFPDGESLVRVQPPAAASQVVLVCTLNDPDSKTIPLLMAASTLRELGAAQVGLVAPYLAYMRQDKRFLDGQAVSAREYAKLLSGYFDWMITVDPHLHRIHDLSEIYSMRCAVLRAAPRIAAWIKDHVQRPLIIGPDAESAQWAADVAARADAPVVVVEKTRLGDKDVHSTVPDLYLHPGRTPVLLDDIVSSGRTLVAVLDHLRQRHTLPPVCIAVHGLFAGDALSAVRTAGATTLAVTDTVAIAKHEGIQIIDLTQDTAQGVLDMAEVNARRATPAQIPVNTGAQP
jgi:ribose-phosphate pyrophosphokinase